MAALILISGNKDHRAPVVRSRLANELRRRNDQVIHFSFQITVLFRSLRKSFFEDLPRSDIRQYHSTHRPTPSSTSQQPDLRRRW